MRLGLGAKFTLAVLTILAATMAANTYYYLETSNRFYEQQLVERGSRARAPDFAGEPGSDLGVRLPAAQQLHPRGVVAAGCGLWRDRESAGNADKFLYQRFRSLDQEIRGSGKTAGHTEAAGKTPRPARTDTARVPIAHNSVLLGRFLVGISRESLQSEFRRQLIVQALVLTALVLF
jgi:hypothetical protein